MDGQVCGDGGGGGGVTSALLFLLLHRPSFIAVNLLFLLLHRRELAHPTDINRPASRNLACRVQEGGGLDVG
eukprot:98866-Chlamydomonas_euryale.AAC.2